MGLDYCEPFAETKLATVTLTENLGLNEDEFDYMGSSSGGYGSWKITLTAVEE